MRNTFLFIVVSSVLIIISYVSVFHIISPGYFSMHDDTQVGRVISMGKALRNGQFPVRWVTDLGYGYGYPIFNFYGPLPYYIGGSLYAVGFDALNSTKLMFILGVILGGFSIYFLVSEVLGFKAGIIAATFYVYAPYHAVQIYIRGSVGEYYTLIFLPLIILSIWRVLTGKQRSSFLVGSIGLSGLILSHTIIGYIGTILFITFIVIYYLYSIFRKYKNSNLITLITILFGGLLFSAFFWLPAFVEMQFTSVSSQISPNANFRDHFVCLNQLWDSAWGFGGSAPGCTNDGMSFKLGKLHILAAGAALLLWILKKIKDTERLILFRIAVILVFFGTFFTTAISKIFWEIIPKFAYIQYPWRFLIFTNLGLSLLAGALISFFKKEAYKFIFTVLLLLLCITIYGKYFTPQFTYQKSSEEFESQDDLRWRVSKISDEYLPSSFIRSESFSQIALVTIPESELWSSKTELDSETYSRFSIDSIGSNEVIIQRAYFPGWKYIVNGKEQKLKLIHALPVINLTDGNNRVELVFKNTPIRLIGNLISAVSIISVLYFYYGRKTFA